MAVLSATDRERVWRWYMRQNTSVLSGTTKINLRAAVDAADVWLNTNTAALTAALPVPTRTSLTGTQQTMLVAAVAMRRAGLLRVPEDG